jgi:CBS domain-containing protein
MIVADLMTPLPAALDPSDSLHKAALTLAGLRVDQMPVVRDGRLIGSVSEHDLVDFGLARGFSADTPVLAVMSHYFDWCYQDDPMEDVAARLADADQDSLIVLTRAHRMAGLITASSLNPSVRTPLAAIEWPRAA